MIRSDVFRLKLKQLRPFLGLIWIYSVEDKTFLSFLLSFTVNMGMNRASVESLMSDMLNLHEMPVVVNQYSFHISLVLL